VRSCIPKSNQILSSLFIDLGSTMLVAGYKTRNKGYERRTTGDERRIRRAFTLLELAVAVGLLSMMILFTSVIFNMSIDTYRMAAANAEIMQKLQTITGQLDADFKAVIWSYPGRIRIETVGNVNVDCIAFLANGDFQSTLQYGSSNSKTVVGDVAGIFYGQALDADPDAPNRDPCTGDPKEKILVRRQTILTSDSSLPDVNSDPRGEYYKKSLSEWEVNPPLDPNEWTQRPSLNLWSGNDLVMYMAKGVDNFTIEWAVGTSEANGGAIAWRRSAGESVHTNTFKFTFTLYDSKGVIKNGKTFTHIVYLGD